MVCGRRLGRCLAACPVPLAPRSGPRCAPGGPAERPRSARGAPPLFVLPLPLLPLPLLMPPVPPLPLPLTVAHAASAHAAAAFFSISATCIRHLVSWDQGWMPSRRQR